MDVPLTLQAEGERVRLRAPNLGDCPRLIAIRARSWPFLAPWSPLPALDADDPKANAALVLKQRREWEQDRAYRFVLADRATDEAVGRVAFGEIVRGVFQNAYLGYWIDEAHARRGLMTEGVTLALDLAFGPLALHRVQIAIIPRNVASLGVMRKLGVRQEGYAERYLCIAGNWEDHMIFAVTAEEWALRPDRNRALVRPVSSG